MKRLFFLALLLLGLASKAEATITATGQQCNARTVGAKSSVSCTVSVTSGNTVMLFAIINANGRQGGYDTAGCSDDKGNTYKLVNMAPSVGAIKVCSAVVGTTASTTFTFTFQGGTDAGAIVVCEFSGLITSGVALDQTTWNATGGANSASRTTLATTTASQLVIAGVQVNGIGTMTCDTGYTQIAEDETGADVTYSTCYKIISSTGTQTHTWTSPSAASGNVIATFSETVNGLTGTGFYFTGHGCNVLPTANRVTDNRCVLPVKAGNGILLVGTAAENDVGGADNGGCSDSLSNTFIYAIRKINSSSANGVKLCTVAVGVATAVDVAIWTNQVGGTGFSGVQAYEMAGLAASPLDQTASNDNGGAGAANAFTGTTGTTLNPNELVVAVLEVDNTGTLTCGAGYSQLDALNSSAVFNYSTCYKVVTTTGTQSMTWTSPASFYAAGIATFGLAPTGGLLPWLR